MSMKEVSVPINAIPSSDDNIVECKGARMEMNKDELTILIPTSGLEDVLRSTLIDSSIHYLRISIPRSDVKKVIQDLYMS